MTQVTFDIPSKKLAPQIPVVVPTKRTTSVVTLLADADILDNFRNSEHAKLGPAHCIPCPEPPAALHSVPPECSSITKSEQSHQINCHPQGNGLGDPAKYVMQGASGALAHLCSIHKFRSGVEACDE